MNHLLCLYIYIYIYMYIIYFNTQNYLLINDIYKPPQIFFRLQLFSVHNYRKLIIL